LDTSELENGRTWHKGPVSTTEDAIDVTFGSDVRQALQSVTVEVVCYDREPMPTHAANDVDERSDIGVADNGNNATTTTMMNDERQVVSVRLIVPRAKQAPSASSLMRSNNDRLFFSVNGRVCDFPQLGQLLTRLYRQLFQSNSRRFPFGVVMISAPPSLLDVNVSTDKRSFYITHLDMVIENVEKTMQQLLNIKDDSSISSTLTTQSSNINNSNNSLDKFDVDIDDMRRDYSLDDRPSVISEFFAPRHRGVENLPANKLLAKSTRPASTTSTPAASLGKRASTSATKNARSTARRTDMSSKLALHRVDLDDDNNDDEHVIADDDASQQDATSLTSLVVASSATVKSSQSTLRDRRLEEFASFAHQSETFARVANRINNERPVADDDADDADNNNDNQSTSSSSASAKKPTPIELFDRQANQQRPSQKSSQTQRDAQSRMTAANDVSALSQSVSTTAATTTTTTTTTTTVTTTDATDASNKNDNDQQTTVENESASPNVDSSQYGFRYNCVFVSNNSH
jgi:hypothetical protein